MRLPKLTKDVKVEFSLAERVFDQIENPEFTSRKDAKTQRTAGIVFA